MSGRKSPSQIQAEKQRANLIEQAEQTDIRALMDLPAFRRYLRRYLALTHVFQTTFTGNSETFFREGQRSVGTTMFGEFHMACPGRFAELMAEPLHSELIPAGEVDED
jgi:hypothetical protein